MYISKTGTPVLEGREVEDGQTERDIEGSIEGSIEMMEIKDGDEDEVVDANEELDEGEDEDGKALASALSQPVELPAAPPS
jgi:hypothetical protein